MVTRQERAELERRMLAVEDPVEMKTEPGTEILVAATPEQIAEDEQAFDADTRHLHDATPAAAMRRTGNVHIRGLGEVT
jgi:hypothetical protein